ncbi:MAG: BlaI/MecI/CopY family transcriptional regulator [Pirellulales bacterium]
MTDLDLPPAELDVMSCLWRGQTTAADVRTALADTRPLSHSSVCTLLGRLEAKGLVERERGPVGKAFVYRPTLPAAGPRRTLLAGLLDRLFAGNRVALVASLLETAPPTPAELAELSALLAELKASQSRPSPKKPQRRKSS